MNPPGFSRILEDVFGMSPMTTFQIKISDALSKEATAEGLLESGVLEALLRERLAAVRVGKMQTARQKMVLAAMPPMTGEEIEAEIKSYRAERRRTARA